MKSIAMIILTMSVGIFFFTNAFAGGVAVSCNAKQINPEVPFEAIISIDSGVQPLGAFQLNLGFDPGDLELKEILSGESEYFQGRLTFKFDNEKGVLIINGFQSLSLEEPKGLSSVATVRIKRKINTSDLFWIHEASLFDTNGENIPIEFFNIE